jgi:hypothetical protein
VAAAVFVTGAAAGDALTEVLGLNKSPSLNVAGDGDATGLAPACAFVRVRLGFGEAAGETADDGDSAVLAALADSVFLRLRFGLGETEDDAAVEGDSACSVGEAVVSVFLRVRCFFAGAVDSAGDSAGAGDCACRRATEVKVITAMSVKNLVAITAIVEKC